MFSLIDIKKAIYSILETHPNGITEYQLIHLLQQEGVLSFGDNSLNQPLILFRIHFLIFHLLYHIKLAQLQKKQDLFISALNIKFIDYVPGHSGLSPIDRLMHFYLDLSYWTSIKESDVEDWLYQFWNKINEKEKNEALALFALSSEASEELIKKTYRKLCMQFHPDRPSGNEDMFKKIHSAWKVLSKS